MRLSRACDSAEAAGNDVERFREPLCRLEIALGKLAICDLVDELDGGDRPPEESERISEIEFHLDRYEAEGTDVSKARAAVERARYVDRCWHLCVEPDSAEADALFDGDDDNETVEREDDAEMYVEREDDSEICIEALAAYDAAAQQA